MRLVIQRVTHASVTIEGALKSKIGSGLLILVGIEDADSDADINWLAQKVVNLRIFDDENGVMNRSVIDIDGEVLIVKNKNLEIGDFYQVKITDSDMYDLYGEVL